MSNKSMSKKEFIERCVYEGGDLQSGFEYGLSFSDLDDDDPGFKALIETAESFYLDFQIVERKVYEKFGYFEEYEGN